MSVSGGNSPSQIRREKRGNDRKTEKLERSNNNDYEVISTNGTLQKLKFKKIIWHLKQIFATHFTHLYTHTHIFMREKALNIKEKD